MSTNQSPRRKRLRLPLTVLTLLLAAVALSLALRVQRPEEPVYEGKPLSVWTTQLFDPTNGAASLKALKSMAPVAADYFFETVRTAPEDTLFRSTYRSWYRRRSPTVQHRLPAPPMDHTAELRRIAGYLRVIANESSPCILAACSDPDRDVRFVAAQVVPYINPASLETVECLAPLLIDEDAAVRGEAAMALLRLRTATKAVAMPWIEQAVSRSDESTPPAFLTILCGILEEIGPAASHFAPLVTPLLESDSIALRTQAAVTLWKISGDTEGISYLVERLKQTQPLELQFRQLLSGLMGMGPAAATAVPVLEQKLSQLTNSAPSPASISLSRDIRELLMRLKRLPSAGKTGAP